MESDWKTFSHMAPKLRERYLAERNVQITAILADPERNDTERFWDAKRVMDREAKVLHRCLDGHSRSTMWQYMLMMINVGMLTKKDLEVFSEELQQELAYAFDRKEQA